MSKTKKFLSIILVLLMVANTFAIGVSAADETITEADYVAHYGIETSATVVHPGDVIDVYLNLTTNYAVFAAQAASVAVGQIISCGVIGLFMVKTIEKNAALKEYVTK